LQAVPGTPDDDARMATRLASGDVDAAAAIYDRYARHVLAVARRVLEGRARRRRRRAGGLRAGMAERVAVRRRPWQSGELAPDDDAHPGY